MTVQGGDGRANYAQGGAVRVEGRGGRKERRETNGEGGMGAGG